MEGRIGKYTIVEEIGRGAMGIVYKAVDPLIDRTVAIKTIRFDMYNLPEQRVEAQKRFLREAKSAGNITHPNIVTIYDMGEDNGVFYIAMEYVDGPSLESLLAARKKWTIEETLRLVIEIADGLDCTHRKGIIHRDIKPGNILIDKEGHPHIVDFGIARIPTSNLTQTSAVMGTPYYMAPEQVAARKVDHRVDIFALGAIFYEMLTLEKPFSGENLTTVIYKIMNENPLPMRKFQADVPPPLEPIIQKILAKDPDARYQSCRAFIDDLMRYADSAGLVIGDRFHARSTAMGETQRIAKPGETAGAPAGRTGRTARKARNPMLLIVGGMALVIVIAAGLVFLTRKGPELPKRPAQDQQGAVTNPTEDQKKTEEKAPADKGVLVAPENKPVENKPVEIKTSENKPAEDKAIKDKPAVPDSNKVLIPPGGKIEAAGEGLDSQAEAALGKGNFGEAMSLARAALKTNAKDERAKTVLTSATVALAPAEIRALIGDYVLSLNNGKLLAFYQTRGTPALYAKLKKNVELMAKMYETMEGAASGETYDFKEARYPGFTTRVRFNHTFKGRAKGKKEFEPLFDGAYIWTLEKTDLRWILVDLVFEAR